MTSCLDRLLESTCSLMLLYQFVTLYWPSKHSFFVFSVSTEPRFEFSTSHNQSLPSVCVYSSLWQKALLYIYWTAPESTTWGKEWDTLQKSLSGFYKVFSCWIPTDPGNIHHCLSTNNYKWLLSTFMVDFREFLSTSAFVSFSKQYIWITLGQGHESIHNLIVQLCIRLGCKRWLPGEFKARMVGSYIVLSKEGKYTKLAVFFFFLS